MPPASRATRFFATRTVDLLLTGHTHDLFIEYDGRTAMVESSHDAHYVTAIDVAIDVKEEDGRRMVTWWPQFRVIDTATVTPDPEVAAVVAKFEGELSKQLDSPIGTTAVELDSRTADGAHARGRHRRSHRRCACAASAQADVAVTNGGGIRGGKIYPPGTTLTRRDILAELPFGNRVVTIDISGRDLKARDRERAVAAAQSQRPLSAGVRPDGRGRYAAARPATASCRSRSAAAARRRQDLSGRDQRFHGARRRRLRQLPECQAAVACRAIRRSWPSR